MATRDLAFYLNPRGEDRHAIMKLLAEAGIGYIGIDGCGWDPASQKDEFQAFENERNEFGLKLCSMHALPAFLAKADSDAPPELIDTHMRELRRFALLGGTTAVYHACVMRDVPMDDIDAAIDAVGWDAFVDRYARCVRTVAREAATFGLTLVIENVWHSVRSQSIAGFMDIITAVDEPNVGVLLDSGHANLKNLSIGDQIRIAGPLLKDTHFHDNAGPSRDGILDHVDPLSSRFSDQHLPVGLGTIDWQDACRALNEIDFPGPVVFEGVLGPGDSIEHGRFGGRLSHKDLIDITIANWRAAEILAEQTG